MQFYLIVELRRMANYHGYPLVIFTVSILIPVYIRHSFSPFPGPWVRRLLLISLASWLKPIKQRRIPREVENISNNLYKHF